MGYCVENQSQESDALVHQVVKDSISAPEAPAKPSASLLSCSPAVMQMARPLSPSLPVKENVQVVQGGSIFKTNISAPAAIAAAPIILEVDAQSAPLAIDKLQGYSSSIGEMIPDQPVSKSVPSSLAATTTPWSTEIPEDVIPPLPQSQYHPCSSSPKHLSPCAVEAGTNTREPEPLSSTPMVSRKNVTPLFDNNDDLSDPPNKSDQGKDNADKMLADDAVVAMFIPRTSHCHAVAKQPRADSSSPKAPDSFEAAMSWKVSSQSECCYIKSSKPFSPPASSNSSKMNQANGSIMEIDSSTDSEDDVTGNNEDGGIGNIEDHGKGNDKDSGAGDDEDNGVGNFEDNGAGNNEDIIMGGDSNENDDGNESEESVEFEGRAKAVNPSPKRFVATRSGIVGKGKAANDKVPSSHETSVPSNKKAKKANDEQSRPNKFL